jgi:hypothetical protein
MGASVNYDTTLGRVYCAAAPGGSEGIMKNSEAQYDLMAAIAVAALIILTIGLTRQSDSADAASPHICIGSAPYNCHSIETPSMQ